MFNKKLIILSNKKILNIKEQFQNCTYIEIDLSHYDKKLSVPELDCIHEIFENLSYVGIEEYPFNEGTIIQNYKEQDILLLHLKLSNAFIIEINSEDKADQLDVLSSNSYRLRCASESLSDVFYNLDELNYFDRNSGNAMFDSNSFNSAIDMLERAQVYINDMHIDIFNELNENLKLHIN